MAEYVEEFAIAVGLDAKELSEGLQEAKKEVEGALQSAKQGLSEVGDASAAASAASASGVSKVADGLDDVGKASQKAAQEVKTGFGGLGSIFDGLKGKIAEVVGVLGLMAGGVQAFSNYVDQSDALGKLSQQLGISVDDLDAWAKANEAAGGSAEALFDSLKAYYDQTGRPAEEFFKLGEKIEGMTRRQAQAYLRAQGVAYDAIPVFLEGQKAADKLVDKYRKTAFTSQDAKNARAFKVAWMDFKSSAQDVGNTLIRGVMPAVKGVVEMLTGLIRIVRENIRVFALLGAGLLVVFGAKQLKSIKDVVGAVKAFGLALKTSFLPVAAIAAGVAALALAIDDLIGFAEGADSAFERLLRQFGMTDDEIESVREAVSGFIDGCKELWEALKPLVGDAVKLAFKGIAVVLGVVAAAVVAVIAGITSLWQWVKDLKKGFDDFCENAKAYLDDLDAKMGALGETIGKALSDAWASVQNWFTGWVDLIDKNIVEPLGNAFSGMKDAMSAALDATWEAVTGWFAKWKDLIVDYVAEPIKSAIKGVGKFFGFGDDDESEGEQGSIVADPRARERVAARVGLMGAQGSTYSTQATVNLTNNFTGYQNPQAIANRVGSTVTLGANRTADLIGQSTRGWNAK